MNFGFVYVITTDKYQKKNIYKIGCTKNLNKRLKTINATRLQRDRFYVIEKWRTFEYYRLETGIHQELSIYKKHNEFFQCTVEQIREALDIFLKKKTWRFIIKDIIYCFCIENKLIWDENIKCFEIQKNELSIFLNDELLLKELKIYIFQFDKFILFNYMNEREWLKYLALLKYIISLPYMCNKKNNKFYKKKIIDNLSKLFEKKLIV